MGGEINGGEEDGVEKKDEGEAGEEKEKDVEDVEDNPSKVVDDNESPGSQDENVDENAEKVETGETEEKDAVTAKLSRSKKRSKGIMKIRLAVEGPDGKGEKNEF